MKVLLKKLLQSPTIRKSLIVSLITTGLFTGLKPLITHAQEDPVKVILPVAPTILKTIREAPYSEMFTINTTKSGLAYGVKERDYQGSNDSIGVYSLWADAPEADLLLVAILYCLPDEAIARSNAHLVSIELSADGKSLVTIDQPAVSTQSTLNEVTPAQQVSSYYYSNYYYDPFWSPGYFGSPYRTSTYIPAVNCSYGGSRLDLSPVKNAIASLPNQSLDLELLFSNGMTAKWRLGQHTVAALKELPSIQRK